MSEDLFGANSPEEGFLDIAANSLAVVLFVTMLLLLTISATTSGRSIPSHDKAVTIVEPKLGALAPFRLYYVISEHGITPLDLSPFHLGFAAGERKVISEIGEATLTIDRQGFSTRDLNSSNAEISFSPAGIAKLALPLSNEAEVDIAFAAIQAAFSTSQAGALTAIIAPGGASQFAPLFHRLEQGDISLRMAPMSYDWSLDFRRKAVDFSSRAKER